MRSAAAPLKAAVLSSYPPMRCGIGDHVSEFAPYLARAGLDLTIVSYEQPPGAPPGPTSPGVALARPLRRGMAPWSVARALRPHLAEADVLLWESQIFLHPRAFNLAPAFLRQAAPIVTFAHDAPALDRLIHASLFLRRLYARSNLIFAHSPVTTRLLVERHGVERERIREVPLGVDTSQFHPGLRDAKVRERAGWGPDDLVVLFLGFLNPGKGVLELLEGFAEAAKGQPRLRLVIAGDDGAPASAGGRGGMIEALRARAKALGVEGRVSFPGFVPSEDVGPWMASADVVAMPYQFIYQSATMFKAMGAGACILATDIEGFSTWMRDGAEGRLVPPRRASAIAEALLELAGDPALRERLRAGAARRAREDHAMDRIARDTLSLMREALA